MTLLAVYFIFILDDKNGVKKQTGLLFFIQVQNVS